MSGNVLDSCLQMDVPFEYLDVENHPTPSDLERVMSKELVDVYLKTCTAIERTLFGRDKQLKGPGDLWIDPEDHGRNKKVKLSPLNAERIQALTHHGILEIGRKIEEKIERVNEMNVEKLVAEADELAKFETDQKIKFYIDATTKSIHNEWEEKVKNLNELHTEEKKALTRVYDDARELLRDFILKKCQREMEKFVSEAMMETQVEMEKNCSESIDRELARQAATFEEHMANTLKNLEINDRDRMEQLKGQCLRAMDVQSHLMFCRQITEMMHMMLTQRRLLMSERGNERKSVNRSFNEPRNDQSKSIKHVWMEFLKHFDNVNVDVLADDEKKLLEKIWQIQDEEMQADKQSTGVDESTELFIVREPSFSDGVKSMNEANLDWVYRKDDGNCGELARPTAIWEKVERDTESLKADDFATAVFDDFLQPQRQRSSLIPQFSSSITRSVEQSGSEINNAAVNEDVMADIAFADRSAAAVNMIPMPRTRSLDIKDSLIVCSRRVSYREESSEKLKVETNMLLSAVDSIDLIATPSRRTSKQLEESVDEPQTESFNIPDYMKKPKTLRGPLFAKMTKDDWMKLEAAVAKDSERRSSVQFVAAAESSRETSRRGSILKQTSSEARIEVKPEENALSEIHQKCREALDGMKIEEILLMLCKN